MGFNENNNRLSIQKAGSPKLPAFNHMNATYNYPLNRLATSSQFTMFQNA